jgi:hypothetical protein
MTHYIDHTEKNNETVTNMKLYVPYQRGQIYLAFFFLTYVSKGPSTNCPNKRCGIKYAQTKTKKREIHLAVGSS